MDNRKELILTIAALLTIVSLANYSTANVRPSTGVAVPTLFGQLIPAYLMNNRELLKKEITRLKKHKNDLDRKLSQKILRTPEVQRKIENELKRVNQLISMYEQRLAILEKR